MKGPKATALAVTAVAVAAALAWFIPSAMGITGASRQVVRVLLTLIFGLGAAAIAWFLRQPKPATPVDGKGASPTSAAAASLDLLVREANRKLAAADLGSLSTLPVIYVIGYSGSAKTSIVTHSGTDPELLSGKTQRDGQIIPTHIANFYLAGKAVLAEAGGEVLNDASSWSELARKLQPGRLGAVFGKDGGQAPRTAIVCVDLEEFTGPDASSSTLARAQALRVRLGDMAQTLGINLPTYVLFTRSDKVAFFADFLRNLTSEEAEGVFGETFQVETAQQLSSTASGLREAKAFDNLHRRLCLWRVEALEREHDPALAPNVYEFPREFRRIRGTVTDFLVELCRPSRLAAGPFLRGFYFTGVRPIFVQETQSSGHAYAQVAADATRAFQSGAPQTGRPLAISAQSHVSRRVPQWVFLKQLFNEVLLVDQAAMFASTANTSTNLLRRIIVATAACLLLVLSCGFLASFLSNRALHREVNDVLVEAPPLATSGVVSAGIEQLKGLDELRQSLLRLRNFTCADIGTNPCSGVPLRYSWGLFIGHELYPIVRAQYWERFNQLLLRHAQSGLLQDLRSLPALPGPGYESTYAKLKAYLITTSNHDKSTRPFLAPILLARWREERNVSAEQVALVRGQFEFYTDELRRENPFSTDNDSGAISHARKYLAGFGSHRRIYQNMLNDAARNATPVNFNRQFAGSSSYVLAPYDVPGAFTAAGWSGLKAALAQPERYFSGDAWVLGNQVSSQVNAADLQRDVVVWYREEHLQHWRDYLKQASVVKYQLSNAAEKLNVLSGNQSPLLALFALASQHTGVDLQDAATLYQPMHFVVPPDGAGKYIVDTNRDYIKTLAALQSAIETTAGISPPGDAEVARIQTAAGVAWDEKRSMTLSFLVTADSAVTASTQRLLEEPIMYARNMVDRFGSAELNSAAKSLCAEQRNLWTKYPFQPSARAAATVSDLDTFLRKPDGAFWRIYREKFEKLIPRDASGFKINPSAPVKLRPEFVQFLTQTAALSEAFYPGDAAEPQVAFTLKPALTEGIGATRLEIEGQTVSSSDAAPARILWKASGTHDLKGWVRLGHSDELKWKTEQGLWSVFRFTGKADRWQQTAKGFLIDWYFRVDDGRLELKSGTPPTIRYELDMGGAPPILMKDYLAGIRCVPEAVARK